MSLFFVFSYLVRQKNHNSIPLSFLTISLFSSTTICVVLIMYILYITFFQSKFWFFTFVALFISITVFAAARVHNKEISDLHDEYQNKVSFFWTVQ